MTTNYKYHALSAGDSVRLLRLSPANDQPHGMLLSLTEARLDNEPEFAALSYTWQLPDYIKTVDESFVRGSGETIEVVCDGKTMNISENLFNFLRTSLDAIGGAGSGMKSKLSRKVAEVFSTMPLWIDAFCINQADSNEKQHQVLLMHRIYSSAQEVLVWLGPEQPEQDVLWIHDVFIPKIAKVSRRNPRFVDRYLRRDPGCKTSEVHMELGDDVCCRWVSAKTTLMKFIGRRRWFDRGWVVQEVALANPSTVLILCGTVGLSWKRLVALARFLHQMEWDRIPRAESVSFAQIYGDLLAQTPITEHTCALNNEFEGLGDKIRKISEIRSTLEDVFQGTFSVTDVTINAPETRFKTAWLFCANFVVTSLRSSMFADDRDHIHGCLGMLSTLLPKSGHSLIIPNYEHCVEEVFASTAALFITKTPLLMELSRVGDQRGRRYPKLPSWVPDYSMPLSNIPPKDNRLPISRPLEWNLDVLAREERDIWGCRVRRPISEGSSLVFYGTEIGVISFVAQPDRHQWLMREIEPEVAQMVVDVGPNLGPLPQQNFWDALASAILRSYMIQRGNRFFSFDFRGHPMKLCKLPEDGFLTFGDTHGRLLQRFHTEAYFYPESGRDDQILEQLRMLHCSFYMAPLYADYRVLDQLSFRSMFLTKDNGMGLGPSSACEGDRVWLLEGARAPLILRKDEGRDDGQETKEPFGRFRFVGEADVRGFDIKTTHSTSEEHRKSFQQIRII